MRGWREEGRGEEREREGMRVWREEGGGEEREGRAEEEGGLQVKKRGRGF